MGATELRGSARKTGKPVRTSVLLPREMVDTLERLSKRSGSSMGDVVRRAILTEQIVRDTTSKGGKVLIKEKDKSVREVVFRR